jgi:hypothetical protein
MDAGYGIYAGGEQRWATLVFNPQAAQWASREEWHPEQQGRWLDDGSFEMRLPYVDDTELLMDVLRQGDQVRVVDPPALVQAVAARLASAAALYPAVPKLSRSRAVERSTALHVLGQLAHRDAVHPRGGDARMLSRSTPPDTSSTARPAFSA